MSLVAVRLQGGPSDPWAPVRVQSLPWWLRADLRDEAVWQNTGLTDCTPTSRASPAEDSQAPEQPRGEAPVGKLRPRTNSQHQPATSLGEVL